MPDAQAYFVRRRGRVEGPWPMSRLRSEISLKQLAAFHEISLDGVVWTQARELEGLFPRDDRRKSRPRAQATDVNYAAFESELEMEPIIEDEPLTLSLGDWHYAVDQQQFGPMSEEDLAEAVLSGRCPLDGLAWHEKFGEQWRPIEQVPELMRLIEAPSGYRSTYNDATPGSYHVAPQSAPQALYALITGVISLLFSWLPMAGFIGVVPFVLGVYALYKINASDGRYGGAGQAVAGLLLGLASMVIALLVVLGVVIWLKAAEPI